MEIDQVRRVRQNHALEHAAVSLLLSRGVTPPLGGYSAPGGFLIFGRASTGLVTEAVRDAAERLRSGQRELAVSPHCGTNLVIGALLARFLSTTIAGRERDRRGRRLVAMVASIVGATLLSRPLGGVLQRRYTTLADLSDLEVAGVGRLWTSKAGRFALHWVRTERSAI